jgi:phosphatidylglycerophosphate synthase
MLELPTEGERWARQELERLREARWNSRALLRFLAASQRRATVTRRDRPADARRAGEWMLVGAAAWGIASSCGWAATADQRRGLAWWAACALMLDWHLGMLETPDGRRVALGAADALTLVRAWLVPVVARDCAAVPALIGALSDLADGAVARRTRTTRLGRDMEGLVDASFAVAAFRSAVRSRHMSPLPVRLELGRLAAGTGYLGWVYFATTHAPVHRTSVVEQRAAALRMASLVAAARGRRPLADRLLIGGTALASVGFLRRAVAAGGLA